MSEGGDDENGNGSRESPYASLAKAVYEVGSGGTVHLLTDITATKLALVSEKIITIDGGGHTVWRNDPFDPAEDQGRGGYQPAMIEVANESEVTFTDITLDDQYLTEGTEFELAGDSKDDNSPKVHDGIIASYGDGSSTIILGDGAVLKNFGGLSAVYITGLNGDGATLIMESGSKICDDGIGSREGGYAAVFNHGGSVVAEAGALIEGIDGRAVYSDNGGVTNYCGGIKDITSNECMVKAKNVGNGGSGFGGVAYYGEGHTRFTLGNGGFITDIRSHDDQASDVMLHLGVCDFTMESGSKIYGINTVGLADMNGATVGIAGEISDCSTRTVPFRMRNSSSAFYLREGGVIRDIETTDPGLVYVNKGKPTIEIAGTIDGGNKPALYISVNDYKEGGRVEVTESGWINNIKDSGIKADGQQIIIKGKITNCSSYAIKYKPKRTNSLLTIDETALIENNNRGGAQIAVEVESNALHANNAQSHVCIAPGTIKGNASIDLKSFDVTLDEGYAAIKLGNADQEVAEVIQRAITSDPQHVGWQVVGSDALWFQPSEASVHFTASRPKDTKNTGLFAVIIPLNADGAVENDANPTLVEVENENLIDVKLEQLTVNQSYALMFVNNTEYTLAPDDVTIYTGGGQGNEEYDDGGFPALTFVNCLDGINTLKIDDQEIETNQMEELAKLFTVSYEDKAGNPVKNDSVPGEYVMKLAWAGGEKHTLTINYNSVADTFGDGTLIVRHIADIEGAKSGDVTHALLTEEPSAVVGQAEAIAKKSFLPTKFYTNDDTAREVDAEGIQLLDDDLLTDEDGTDRQGMLEDKAEQTDGLLPKVADNEVYRYDFHYLDLVDAHNGNAWVSASGGTTVYLPYPEGVDSTNAEKKGLTVVHYPGLHREYGIAGQAEVEDAIEACVPEEMTFKCTDVGIEFDTECAGFSPFAIVWKEDAEQYTITASAGAGGSIFPAGSVKVTEGSDQTFTITPGSGYEIADVLVDGSSVGAVSSYTFEDVRENHAISASFKSTGSVTPPTPSKVKLTYVENGGSPVADVTVPRGTSVALATPVREGYTFEGWFFDSGLTDPAGMGGARITLYANTTVYAKWSRSEAPGSFVTDHINYIMGRETEDGERLIAPLSDVTRAEVATMVFRLLKPELRDEHLTDESGFADVPADAWYAEPVATLAAMGAVKGYPQDGLFHPDDPITRAELVTIVTRLDERFDEGEWYGDLPFDDVPADHWALSVLSFAVNRGWLSGDTYDDGALTGSFRPDDSITRAETMAVLNRMLGRLPESEGDLLPGRIEWPDNQDKDAWYWIVVEEATNNHDHALKADGVHERWTRLLENVAE